VLKRIECLPVRIEDPLTAASYPVRLTVPLADGKRDSVQEVLTWAGYRLVGDADHFYAVKNRLSPLATILFHLSFFLILLAGVITTYTKFVGYLDLGIGESFHGELSRYKGTPRLPKIGKPPVAGIALEKVQPHVDQNVATGLEVVVRDDRGGLHTTDINRPYKTGVTSFLVNDLGVAPLVVIQDANGRDLDGAYVKLDVMKGKKDRFHLLGYEIEARYFSDHVAVNGVDETRSDAFSNPAMRLEVSNNGVVVAARTLKAGESMELDGNRLVLQEMPFWVRFLVVKQHGDWVAYAGFIIATFALCWRLLWYRREIVGAVEQTGTGAVLHLACRCEFYRTSSRQEIDRLGQLIEHTTIG
jgi:ResB-like family protein